MIYADDSSTGATVASPIDVLDRRFGGPDANHEDLYAFWADVVNALPPGLAALELGLGPVFSAIPLSAKFARVEVVDPDPELLSRLERSLSVETDAFDWRSHIRMNLRCEARAAGDAETSERMRRLREAVLILGRRDPLGAQPPGVDGEPYDLVAAQCRAQNGTVDTCTRAIGVACALVKPGGWCVLAVPAAERSRETAKRALDDAGFEILRERLHGATDDGARDETLLIWARRTESDPRFRVVHDAFGNRRLIATVPFGADEVVMRFGALPNTAERNRLTLQVEEDRHIELDPPFLECANHGCDPNVALDPVAWTVMSLRAIAPGEELRYFYPATEWSMASPFDCNCGARDCVGRIDGAATLPDEILARYRIAPHILRLRKARS